MTNPNYTPEMVAALQAEADWNLETAKRVGLEMGKSTRSIIAKVISLGLAYESQKPTRKDGAPVVRKTEYVAAIAKALAVPASEFKGLEKAPRVALENLLREIP